jgi:hypothetical protein
VPATRLKDKYRKTVPTIESSSLMLSVIILVDDLIVWAIAEQSNIRKQHRNHHELLALEVPKSLQPRRKYRYYIDISVFYISFLIRNGNWTYE